MRFERALRQLKEAISRQDKSGLEKQISLLRSIEVARLVSHLNRKDQNALFNILNIEQAADVVETLEDSEQKDILSQLPDQKASDLIQAMESNEGADLLRGLSSEKTQTLLNHMDSKGAEEARELISYAKDSAGDLMSKEFIAFNEQAAVTHVLSFLKNQAARLDQYKASYVYVVDSEKKLIGVLRMRDLILKSAETNVTSIMIQKPKSLRVNMSKQEVERVFETHQFLALPVVNDAGTLLGIVTQADVAESSEENAAKTFLKFSGIAGGEELRTMPLSVRIRNRLSWLSVNIVLNIASASVIALFQDTLQAVVALTVFLPIISDMSGCSGSQAVAVSIRELTLGRIGQREYRWILGKEFLVGLVNGLVLGFQVGLVALLWKGIPMLGLVVALALWINTMISVLIGGLLPVMIARFRMDPAIVSPPVLTTITDFCGFFLVLSLAKSFLPYLTG